MKVSLIVRGLTQRMRFHIEPALSFVPDARAPPNGCWPTTAPGGFSVIEKFAAAARWPRGAGLVVRARRACAAERLLADDSSGRLVVDVEVARRVAEPVAGLVN